MKPELNLTGMDGNAFVILGAATKAIRRFYEKEEAKKIVDAYMEEAQSGDYDHLIQTTMKYCDVS